MSEKLLVAGVGMIQFAKPGASLHDHHPARAPDLLRGPHRAAGQEATGGTVRRHPAQTAQTGGHR